MNYNFKHINISINFKEMRHMTHIIDDLTPFASSDGLAQGFVGFAIPKNPYIQIFSIFVSFLRAPDQNE